MRRRTHSGTYGGIQPAVPSGATAGQSALSQGLALASSSTTAIPEPATTAVNAGSQLLPAGDGKEDGLRGRGLWSRSRTSWMYLLGFSVFCLETFYIVSEYFAKELLRDELTARLGELQSNYDRSQAVINTLTHGSAHDAEYESCVKMVSQALKEKSLLQEELASSKRRLEGAEEGVARKVDLRPWLVIGIPTVARRKAQYLSRTLEHLARQLPMPGSDPLYGRLKIVVMNNNPEGHSEFSRNQDVYENSPWAGYFDFQPNSERKLSTPQYALLVADTARRAALAHGRRQQLRDLPDARVQQQTRDVASLLRYVRRRYDPEHYLFMEDDMLLCENGIEALRHLINRATLFHGDWIAARASFGLNGIVTHGGEDLANIASYLEKHQARRPPDHLVVEWFAGETNDTARYKGGRKHVAFRFNIYEHIGKLSSIRSRPLQRGFPICWEPLAGALFEVEAFNAKECAEDTIWPCRFNASCTLSSRPCLYDDIPLLKIPPPPMQVHGGLCKC